MKCADELKFLESEVFKTLEKFAKDDEIKDLTLPAIYFNQVTSILLNAYMCARSMGIVL